MSSRSRLWRVAELPTTRAGVERAFSYFIAGVRIGTLAQMIPAVHAGVTTSPHGIAYAVCWAAAALASVAVSVATLVRRRPLGAAVSALDYTLACLLLLLGPLVLVPGERFGTWVAYQPGYALSVIITAGGVRSVALWAGGMFGIAACYLVYLGGAFSGEMISTAVGNILTFVVYALVARMFFGYTRRIAHDADTSRARAAELARREEERRAQVMMHNGVAVMRMLTEPGTDAARSRLLDLAEVEVQRMRSYLRGRPPDRDGDGSDTALAAIIERACERFADLPVETLLDLGAGVRLSAGDAEAVERALDSLLLNVRAHARADGVVVHLDQGPDGGWTLTVRDDGVGFDPAAVTPGVGLREVVVGELRRRGLDVDVESAVDSGTTVTISCHARSAACGDHDAVRDAA
ncbi:sensor histidine kinase [Micromonospora sp. NPDC049497]|uniref:sensor histidine kinase n=1 Tax=Micromonospora sp. NPDC049497 TaxID=3364273 RepID=UPI0037B9B6B5